MNLPAYHAYYFFGKEGATAPVLLMAQLLSARLWKQHWGDIRLVCNKGHLEQLQEYGIEQEYTDVLPTLQERDPRWWSLAKLEAAKVGAASKQPFAVLDTDLWFTGKLDTFAPEAQLQMLHWEGFDEEAPDSPYCRPSIITSLNLPSWEKAANAAFMYFNDQALVDRWLEVSFRLFHKNSHWTRPLPNNQETIFLEQRLLPALALHGRKDVRILLPTTFNGHLTHLQEHCWEPLLSTLPQLQQVRHLWGDKSKLSEDATRQRIIARMLADAEQCQLTEQEYPVFFSHLHTLLHESTHI